MVIRAHQQTRLFSIYYNTYQNSLLNNLFPTYPCSNSTHKRKIFVTLIANLAIIANPYSVCIQNKKSNFVPYLSFPSRIYTLRNLLKYINAKPYQLSTSSLRPGWNSFRQSIECKSHTRYSNYDKNICLLANIIDLMRRIPISRRCKAYAN